MDNTTALLTDDQVFQLCGIKPKTLANWRCTGVGPAFVKVGHHIRYRPQDLQAFLDSRVFKSTSDYSAYQAAQKKEREARESMKQK